MKYESTPHVLKVPFAQGQQQQDKEEQERQKIDRIDIFGDGSAVVLRGLLSPAECQSFISQAESFGIEPTGYRMSIRQTDRVAAKSTAVAEWLMNRIRPFLQPINLSMSNKKWPKGVPWFFPRRNWNPVGLNEMFRLCRYEPGGFFLPHHDAGFVRSESERSLKTFMIYLNNDFEGGATNFYRESQRHYQPGDLANIIYSFRPEAGDALIFNSAMLHDGEKVMSGRKYIMRSEIMYSSVQDKESSPGRSVFVKPDHDDVGEEFVPDSNLIDSLEEESDY